MPKINILVALFTTLFTCSCVDDESTLPAPSTSNDNSYSPVTVKAMMDEQQKKIISLFYEGADPTTGMAYNNPKYKETLTTGASGMGVMCIVAGVERGWIDRAAGAEHIAKMTRFLKKATRFEGAWSHWYYTNGAPYPFGNQVAAGEIVETAFMMGGLLTACEYFTGNSDAEKEIRENTQYFWETINWKKFIKGDKLYWIWHSDKVGQNNELELQMIGWNECLLIYILGMAAPDHLKIPQSIYSTSWKGWNFATPSRKTYGYLMPLGTEYGGSLFLSQYSFLGLDPRLMEDNDVYYWTQNVSHTMINRHYCIFEAPAEYNYSELNWGLTACGGCGSNSDYKGRRPFQDDDGVIAPTASISAYPFTPFYSTQVMFNMSKNFPNLNGEYGFSISYSPSEKSVGTDYLAMEHAPMAIMIENYRTGLIWNLLMKNEYVQKGLQLAGMKSQPNYQPGFYLAMINTATEVYDMMRHPDSENYEINFYTTNAGNGTLKISNMMNEIVFDTRVDLTAGTNTISFFNNSILRGKKYTLSVSDAANKTYSIPVILR